MSLSDLLINDNVLLVFSSVERLEKTIEDGAEKSRPNPATVARFFNGFQKQTE